jgi:hypothetical protein
VAPAIAMLHPGDGIRLIALLEPLHLPFRQWSVVARFSSGAGWGLAYLFRSRPRNTNESFNHITFVALLFVSAS